jgi:phenylacetate-CoA oxygenase PaaH subunit
MNSLDPRVNRLPEIKETPPKGQLDQLGTYEVFVQPKEGKPFQHEGIVHAPDLEMAFILAKESLTRRFQCISLFVTDTRNVISSEITEGDVNAYDLISNVDSSGPKQKYEIFIELHQRFLNARFRELNGRVPGDGSMYQDVLLPQIREVPGQDRSEQRGQNDGSDQRAAAL